MNFRLHDGEVDASTQVQRQFPQRLSGGDALCREQRWSLLRPFPRVTDHQSATFHRSPPVQCEPIERSDLGELRVCPLQTTVSQTGHRNQAGQQADERQQQEPAFEPGSGRAARRRSGFDFVLLVMNKRGMKRLMTSRFTIGGDAAAAAGPVGRTITANTDAFLSAEILSWSRSRGVFAGISLDGATLREDLGVNETVYNTRYTNKNIVEYDLVPAANAKQIATLLNKYSGRKGR